jgi:hypothetical protein
MFIFCSGYRRPAAAVNAIAPCTLPDEAAPLAEQMRALKELADYAMRMVRIAVEQYEAYAATRADSATTPPRRLPCPGSLFIRAARVVQNCILGQSRLLAGLPLAGLTRPRTTSAREAATQTPIAEPSRAEPLRQALRTVTRNHPHGPKLLSAGLENLAAALTADPRAAANLPDIFRRVCDASGIQLNPSQLRKASRDLSCGIRAAPA